MIAMMTRRTISIIVAGEAIGLVMRLDLKSM